MTGPLLVRRCSPLPVPVVQVTVTDPGRLRSRIGDGAGSVHPTEDPGRSIVREATVEATATGWPAGGQR
jgi:hypothetical protein